ncbi:MAG: VCBS repeat-containing protein, partial [Flavobacteriales bacterium]|nr:VCBS repeat-containing protein [Flavobacteriales bacterium]
MLSSGQFSDPRSITTELVLDAGAIASGDTDGDGDPEIVVGGSAGLVLFENTDGQGTFQPVVVLDRSVYIWCEALHIVDVDHDGLADIVIEAEDIVWCRNLGGNVFSLPAPFPGTGVNHHKIAFDDYDGDGDQDAIM